VLSDTGDLISTEEVARIAGVGPSAVKRWADQGLLDCLRTPGGHRRFSRAEVDALVRRQRRDAGGSLLDLLLRTEDGHAVDAHLMAQRARLGAWYRVAAEVGNSLADLGRLWAEGRISIMEEHLASERLARGLARVSGALPVAPGAPQCLLATVEGDDHTLGLSLVELCLREAGWNTSWAGRFIPSAELARAVRAGSFRMLALSAAASSADALSLRRQAQLLGEACRTAGVELVLGGSGAWPDAPPYGWRFHALAAFASWARQLAERVTAEPQGGAS
jgi:MerR family transcriptional regulator, light-induced transcriptional regulator